jgi:DNA polymerase V
MSTPLDDESRLPSHDIMCIDCKSFYASVEAVRRGEFPLAAKIAVMSNEESRGGLILASSPNTKYDYHVKLGTRRYEIDDTMDIEMVQPHMADYIRKNYQINQIYQQFTDAEHWFPYSIDESFIDVTGSHALFGTNDEIAAAIQDKVFKATGIVTTVGIGENMLLAKLALDNAAKRSEPWRATWTYKQVPETLWQITNLTDFWSIGPRYAARLERMGIHDIYTLAHTDVKLLKRQFGVMGEAMYYHAWGIDYSDMTRRYAPRSQNKGFGNSQVLMKDYRNPREIETVLSEIADQVATRLRKHGMQGEIVGIAVGFAEPDAEGKTHWGAQMHVDPTNSTDDLIRAVRWLFESKWQGNALRNLAVRVSRVSEAHGQQLDLFVDPSRSEANMRLEATIDKIRNQFGYKALVRGYSKTDGATAIKRSGLVGGHQG